MPRYRHDPTKSLVGFEVGDVAYAVRIEVVREIVNPLVVVPLPRSPRAVRGVADYRGEVVPVIDLRERFGLGPAESTRRHKWIVLDVGAPPPSQGESAPRSMSARYAALVVDAVTEVFGTGGGEVRPAPPLGKGDDVRGIEGVVNIGKRLVFVLDARAFSALAQAALAESVLPPPLPPVERA
jgi:purine-binding chemotaxis protein CheW